MSSFRARRQNHSCEQCRRSKKACDGFFINEQLQVSSNTGAQPVSSVLPCSYCIKTKKQCSLNDMWYSAGSSASAPVAAPAGDAVPVPAPAHLGGPSPVAVPSGTDPWVGSMKDSNGVSSLQTPLPDPTIGWEHSLDTFSLPLLPSHAPHMSFPGPELTAYKGDPYYAGPVEPSAEDWTSQSMPPQQHAGFPNPNGEDQGDVGGCPSMQLPTPVHANAMVPYGTSTCPDRRKKRRRSSPQIPGRRYPGTTSLSPHQPPHNLMATCNGHLIADSLLRIYHDVLENNLACWLADENCPYKLKPMMQSFSRQQSYLAGFPSSSNPMQPPRYARSSSSSSSSTSSSPEWGAVWSNHMFRRVKEVESVAQRVGLVNLTAAESQTAARALNLAIMAFAAQWAQGGRRHRRFPTDFESPWSDDVDEDDFEQHLQLTLWESAKRTLDAAEHIESFRVVYAEFIFEITQKPWLAVDRHEKPAPYFHDVTDGGSFRDVILSQVQEIIEGDGPPVYLSRASRQIHALKFRCESLEAAYQQRAAASASPLFSETLLTEEQRSTVGLLYWLIVMADTVSSSMSHRPVILSNEDCQHDSADAPSPVPTSAAQETVCGASYHWDLSLFARDDPDRPSAVRWPCPYEDAARAVTRSAAVKVLLFRYVSYLQDALRQGQDAQAIEELIMSATRVYRYWNATHGALFRDFIAGYDGMPARLKSWFPCIHIPWHLGTLLFADLVDYVDSNGLGDRAGSGPRASAHMTARMRAASATELADLARVTTPQLELSSHDGGDCDDEADVRESEQLPPSYHFAVNEGTLLTEPWTLLLIQAFAKACIFHLGAAEDLRRHGWQAGAQQQASLRHSRACVRALWFLGRKSDMARNLSLLFAGVMKRLRGRQTMGATLISEGRVSVH